MRDSTGEPGRLQIGVDVGGTFTDLVAWDGRSLRVVKVPSTPPGYERGVIEAVMQVVADSSAARVVHGSTVATNALLQRAGEPVAFVTTEGFRDMLLIGRQNRPRLYALRVERPAPITAEENWFTVRERIDRQGGVVQALEEGAVEALAAQLRERGLRHAAVCLLFSFANSAHERLIQRKLEEAGLTVSISSEVLPEFREYERASTTAINAALGPRVAEYLRGLKRGMPAEVRELRIMQSGGGTLSVEEAERSAARLVLSGPAGGVMGAAFAAEQAGVKDIISYDMGGTSTDVAVVREGRPQWTTRTVVDGLPIGVPMFDIHTVGAGGGSIAYLDVGGALRVGPRSAGAEPGPACYGRGGVEPTVTDANVVLGRMVPDALLGGKLRLVPELAERAVGALAGQMGKTLVETALGIVRIAEANMAAAIRAVTSRRGHDPRDFALVSFGGAGGLHACALAASLEIRRVLVPPHCGVLSALGMVVAPALIDVAQTVLHLGERMSDEALGAAFARLEGEAAQQQVEGAAGRVERFADVRFRGQSHEVKVAVEECTMRGIERMFLEAYRGLYGHVPEGREIEVVTLRVRRIGERPRLELPRVAGEAGGGATKVEVIDAEGRKGVQLALTRAEMIGRGEVRGPLLIIDPDATCYIPAGWVARGEERGMVVAEGGG